MDSRQAYMVVVLPEPVGPVTSTIPKGVWMAFNRYFSGSGSNPRVGRSNDTALRSRMRRATFSPKAVGMMDTRMSIGLPWMIIRRRPSVGKALFLDL